MVGALVAEAQASGTPLPQVAGARPGHGRPGGRRAPRLALRSAAKRWRPRRRPAAPLPRRCARRCGRRESGSGRPDRAGSEAAHAGERSGGGGGSVAHPARAARPARRARRHLAGRARGPGDLQPAGRPGPPHLRRGDRLDPAPAPHPRPRCGATLRAVRPFRLPRALREQARLAPPRRVRGTSDGEPADPGGGTARRGRPRPPRPPSGARDPSPWGSSWPPGWPTT